MAYEGIFVSNVRCNGDFAGVFEHDGRNAYFSLYDLTREQGSKAVRFVRIPGLPSDLQEKEVEVEWDEDQANVGLFIRRKFQAAFAVGCANDIRGREASESSRPPNLGDTANS